MYVLKYSVVFNKPGGISVKLNKGQEISKELWALVSPETKKELTSTGVVGDREPRAARKVKKAAAQERKKEEAVEEQPSMGSLGNIFDVMAPPESEERTEKHPFKETAKNQPRENSDAALERLIAAEEGDGSEAEDTE